jgi:hypothetical protein
LSILALYHQKRKRFQVEEYFKSFRSALKDRWSGPLFGNFILAWFVFNWRILYITLFVDGDKLTNGDILIPKHLTKLEYIDQFLISPSKNLVYPALFTVGLILIYPAFAAWAVIVPEYFATKRNNWRLKMRKTKIVPEDDLITALQEIDEEKKKFLESKKAKDDIQAAYAKLLVERNEEGKTLLDSKAENEELTQKVADLTAQLSIKQDEIVKLKVKNDNLKSEALQNKITTNWHLEKEIVTVNNTEPMIVSSKFILSDTGSISIWVKVPPTDNFYQREMNHLYIVGHDTNQGRSKSPNPKIHIYENAFGLKLSPDFTNTNKRHPTKVWWSFWVTNAKCEAIEVNTDPLDYEKEEWHHFLVRWNHLLPNLELIIDGITIRTTASYINSWPKSISGELFVGNWPNKLQIHNLGMPITRLAITDEYFNNAWLQKELTNKPREGGLTIGEMLKKNK